MMEYLRKLTCGLGIAGVMCGAVVSAQDAGWLEGQPATWRNPITNPIYNDVAMIKRELRLVYIWQTLPSHIKTIAGNLPLDGDLNAVAVQFEWPILQNLSIVANKSGWIDFNPDDVLSKEQGWNDLSAGLKWAFWQRDALTMALRATVELPIGEEDVLQSNGDGHVSPALLVTQAGDCYTLNGVLGATIPFDAGEESTVGYLALSGAYRVTRKLSAHLEMNWFRVLEDGSFGKPSFNGQLGPNLPILAEFEGGDLVNLGANNAKEHPDFVSVGVGARYQLTDALGLGVAAEMPLSTKDQGLMDKRITANLTLKF